MDSEHIQEILDRLQALYREADELERQLFSLGITQLPIVDPERIRQLNETLEQLKRAQEIYHALARVDFNDDYYEFIRAIDGDTIVVAPPAQLRRWIRDIHVRLYGLETPELWEELGQDYRQHLEELCAIDARRRLMIVWERERSDTNYEGFPLSSFERGIGHLFFRTQDGRFVYVNGLMNVLEHSSLERRGRSLLRGRRRLEQMEAQLPWVGHCPSWHHVEEETSPTLQSILATGPPACLLTFAGLPRLDPRDPEFSEKICVALHESWGFGCPLEPELHRCTDVLRQNLAEQEASPFDVPLTFLSMWAASR